MNHQFLLGIVLALSANLYAAADAGPAAPAPEKPVPGQGLFVAVGYNGFRGWSLDGQAWNLEPSPDKSGETNIASSLIYRAGVFYAAGGGTGRGFIVRSTDGKHWDEVVTARFRVEVLLDLGDRLLSAYDGHFQLSTDGLTWKPAAEDKLILPEGGGGYCRRCVVGNGVAVLAGDYSLPGVKTRIGWIGGTRNGETSLAMTRAPTYICGLAFGNGHFIACSKDGTLLVSSDGLQFKSTSSGETYDDNAVRFHDGLFYLRGKGAQTSPDGEHWTPLAMPPHLPGAVSPEGIAISWDWGGISVAPDGKTWRRAPITGDPKGIMAGVYGVPLANLAKDAGKATKKP